jgi:hypothetical protein
MSLATSGCTTFSPAVPELDGYTLPASTGTFKVKIRNGHSTKQDVESLLGLPPVVLDLEWCYPVRARSRVRAAMLQVRFDAAGLVSDWGFYHPVTREPLEVRETMEQALAYAPRTRGGRTIILANILATGVSSRSSIQSSISMGNSGRYVVDTTGDGETLTFFVDRPSPLYVPPFWSCFRFDERGTLNSQYGAGYGTRFEP